MEVLTDANELTRYLHKIRKIFDTKAISGNEIESQEIINYYKQSELGFRFIHSSEGSLHMALNPDGVFNENGYYEQAKFVAGCIPSLQAKRILELGSGKGFNSIFLAKEYPGVSFTGIDLTPTHVSIAKEKSRNLENVRFEIGDFQALAFEPEVFDLVFEVESVCHALNMELALSEIHNVLKKAGVFIMFDGFRKPGFEKLNNDLKMASELTEICMAVGKPWIIDDFIALAEKAGFTSVEVNDISMTIMPNLRKFQTIARLYFKYPRLAKVIRDILPNELIMNTIALLLMPFTIKGDAQAYYRIVLRRD